MEIIKYQQGIIEPVTQNAMFMMFDIKDDTFMQFGLRVLQKFVDGKHIVAGFGNNLLAMFDMPEDVNYRKAKFQSELMSDDSGYDLVLMMRGDDKGDILHNALSVRKALADFFEFKNAISSYTYHKTFDLSGFEDGIENPVGEEIVPASIVSDGVMEGSSFWVLQQWQHDFKWLDSVSQVEKEECIGRSLDDSHQFEKLKDYAHVVRSAKENFEPEAELLRRSMPWSNDKLEGGLMFSCFATSFRSFNLQMGKMLGIDDGIIDGVFKFSKILSTNYLWCPPFKKGKIDISLLKK